MKLPWTFCLTHRVVSKGNHDSEQEEDNDDDKGGSSKTKWKKMWSRLKLRKTKRRGDKRTERNISVASNIPVSQRSTSSSSTGSTPSTLVPEDKTISSDHAVVSRQSSYSNCSSIPDEGKSHLCWETETEEMNDEPERMSKSKKRRQRRRNVLNRSTSHENRSCAVVKDLTQETIAENPEESTNEQEIVLSPQEEPHKNIESLKLKRIEHKYKVESPKELKIDEKVKSKDKKLMVKSKSLDDDDYLKIQELSEVSESEDSKPHPLNVVISEASSDENLLDDSDSDTRKSNRTTLSSISLILNDDNHIESKSNISPEEEQKLRTFLGELNLIDTPEDSAKDLLDRTSPSTDSSKHKKIQTRKELEQYFMPIAQNPRFLDAISEETSDISDKECQTNAQVDKNPKQGTPEQDERQKPPPIPPRRNRSKLLKRNINQSELSSAILVETKILEPLKPQETDDEDTLICNTTTLPESFENAERVYISESSDSSLSGNEQIEENGTLSVEKVDKPDRIENNDTHTNECSEEETETKTESKTVTNQNTELKNDEVNKYSSDILEIDANESNTTNYSSQLTCTTKISRNQEINNTIYDKSPVNSAPSLKVVPPLSQESNNNNNAKEVKSNNGSVLKQILFDYTKPSNVLTQKEPDSLFKALNNHSVQVFRNESHSEQNSDISFTKSTCDSEPSKVMNLTTLNEDRYLKQGDLEKDKVVINTNNQSGNIKVNHELVKQKYVDQSTEVKLRSKFNTIENKLDENVLKHVMMGSKDSNKTDSEKLLEFESICKINSELKSKISKQESFGSVKKQTIEEKLKKDIEKAKLKEEPLPTTNLVQKRVKEFSQEHNGNIVFDDSLTEKETEIYENGKLNEKNNKLNGTSNLVKSRTTMFSEVEKVVNEHISDNSVLKKLLIPKGISIQQNVNEIQIKDLVNEKIDLSSDILIPVQIEKSPTQLKTNKEVIIPVELEQEVQTETKFDKPKLKNEDIIRPLSQNSYIEKCNTNTGYNIDTRYKKFKETSKSLEDLSLISKCIEENNRLPINSNKNNNVLSPRSENTKFVQTKETIIPVQTEPTLNQQKNKNEIMIPIKLEQESKAQSDLNNQLHKENKIPSIFENNYCTQKCNNHVEKDLDIGYKHFKNVSKSVENLSTSNKYLEESNKLTRKYVSNQNIANDTDATKKCVKEVIIPIKIEEPVKQINTDQCNGSIRCKETIIPITTETNIDKNRQEGNRKNIQTKEYIIPIKTENNLEKDKNLPIKTGKDSTTKLPKEEVLAATKTEIKTSIETKFNKEKTDTKEIIVPIYIEEPTKADAVVPSDDNYKPSKNITKSQNDESIPENNETIHDNILSPPRRDSVSSDSSGESSRCTAKYNPTSSIGDVSSITKDEESDEVKRYYEPLPLRSLVLNFLISQPFGEEILKELAEVSKSIENYTNKLPFIFNHSEIYDKGNNVSVMPSRWYTQKDLHHNENQENNRKYVEHQEHFYMRRTNDEGDRDEYSRENEVMSPNRLLTIIKEESSEAESSREFEPFEDDSRKRLQAKNLSEWLTLARNKSKSTSHLDSISIPINSLRRTFSGREQLKHSNARRNSLPQEIYERQLRQIMEKEMEIQRELEKLEDEKRKIQAELAPSKQKEFQVDDFYVSKKGDFAEIREENEPKTRPASMPVFPTEFFRQQMYDEYMNKFTERQERKQQKVIKISSSNDLKENDEPLAKEIIHPIELEQEFMDKVKAKHLGRSRDNSKPRESHKEPNNSVNKRNISDNPTSDENDEPPVIVLDRDQVKTVDALPKHLQEFVDEISSYQDDSIWSPGQSRYPPTPPLKGILRTDSQTFHNQRDEPVSPVWTPKSATSSPTADRKEFRPVNFQSPVLSRKSRTQSDNIATPDSSSSEPPWRLPEGSSDTAINLSSTLDRRLPTSQSSPGFGSFSTTPRLPRVQNPTITLLQKAREGQLPRGAHYIDQDRKLPNDRPPIKYPGEVLYHIKNEYTSESDSERPRKMADLAPRKFEGIGPTTKDGMPLILRSEVKDKDQSKWYKRMYDTIHKQKPHRDEYVTIKYKQKRAQYPYTSGYLSEPEPGAYDSDFTEYKYATLDRRRPPTSQEYLNTSTTMPRNVPDKSYSSSDIVKNTPPSYKIQPGRIENYKPGHSSISDKEAKKWWDEVMDIFDGWLDDHSALPSYEVMFATAITHSHLEQQSRVPTQKPRSFINQALKESGYESDSTLVFKRKEDTAKQVNPREQREAYKIIQQGGDVPFQGLRKPAPERPKEPDIPPPPALPTHLGGVQRQDQESPRKYVENEVTIHYKTPVRTEIKEYVSEDELAHRQAEAMRKIYEEEKRRKHLQELQDMKSRRHTDNFIPSQKSPISLNRYDDFEELASNTKTRPRSPEPRLVAKALYNFVGHTARELTFRKGDLIYLRRQVDKNWYEGELNAMIGLFPVNYVEIVPYEGAKTTPRKAHEGQARAKYNFLAQTHLELSLAKGELVTITRKVDDNWFEGKIGGRKGIFPVSYVEVLIDPSEPPPPSTKPVASPAAHSLLLNGSSQGKESMGSHLYTPNLPNPLTVREGGFHHAKPVQLTGSGTYSTLPKSSRNPLDQTLHIETHSEPIPYRALYKYTPQNDDELELLEGDTVYVLEKCDDGWYVGSSERTGAFGTFPGNYVEKI
ncbi:uncharacterized protein LOC115880570 isoform X2 [Sitophilus oryzae]|uniref:Uncharacterized protein LOC115880570 isoform X2 n=1 Tax=Sitophilus oryzae TaxID=7048 RepID=A0A6J2XRK7_SITOR|nr:uncharacterized protein LOC115880570 isoform X2 [Sitophilus oryzae]